MHGQSWPRVGRSAHRELFVNISTSERTDKMVLCVGMMQDAAPSGAGYHWPIAGLEYDRTSPGSPSGEQLMADALADILNAVQAPAPAQQHSEAQTQIQPPRQPQLTAVRQVHHAWLIPICMTDKQLQQMQPCHWTSCNACPLALLSILHRHVSEVTPGSTLQTRSIMHMG